MISDSFVLLLPILLVACGGYLVSWVFPLSKDTLVRVVTDFFMPMLIFHSLYVSDIELKTIYSLAGVTSFVVFSLLLLTFLYTKLFKLDFKGFIPPVIFMNSGFLGIPLMQLWGGLPAMNLIVIYDQIQTVYIFTLGILIITGGFNFSGLSEMVKSPILWAIFTGFFFNFFRIPVPKPVLDTFSFGGNAAPAVAAFVLGVSLRRNRLSFNGHLFFAIFIRIIGGFSLGLLGAVLFRIDGTARIVVIVASSLPSAVFSSVLPMRYGVKADFASTMVVVTTITGIITIPLSFYLSTIF